MNITEQRNIVHFDLDTFFLSVERLLNPKLIGKPVLIGGTSDRGVVAACSYETRMFGVHNGMAMKIARRLCPDAVAMRGDAGYIASTQRLLPRYCEIAYHCWKRLP